MKPAFWVLMTVLAFLFYVMGYNDGKAKIEAEIGAFWGKYYFNNENALDYWELRAKKEGLK